MNDQRGSTKAVAIIPARGGSKGLERKNLRPLHGTPLLYYALSAAHQAKGVIRTVVSTDDQQIADFAENQGALVLRHPVHLSVDEAPSFPVVQWALQQLRAAGLASDMCVVLRATAPLTSPIDIEGAVELLSASQDADAVASVVERPGIHPIKLKRVNADGYLHDAFESEGQFPKRRQELECFYVRNEALYVSRSSVIEAGSLWGKRCLAYIMPPERSININSDFDFRVAELVMRSLSDKGEDR
jgi:CMP-N,N'-diacetyllegionaminic acid synthase